MLVSNQIFEIQKDFQKSRICSIVYFRCLGILSIKNKLESKELEIEEAERKSFHDSFIIQWKIVC